MVLCGAMHKTTTPNGRHLQCTKPQLKLFYKFVLKIFTMKSISFSVHDAIQENLLLQFAKQNNIELETENIFLGSPEITLDENGRPTTIPITEKGATQVQATGYIENGEIVLNREIKDVNKTFVGKLSKKNEDKKIPIIVIKKGAYYIAYPINMVKTSSPQTDLFDGILNSNIVSSILKVESEETKVISSSGNVSQNLNDKGIHASSKALLN